MLANSLNIPQQKKPYTSTDDRYPPDLETVNLVCLLRQTMKDGKSRTEPLEETVACGEA